MSRIYNCCEEAIKDERKRIIDILEEMKFSQKSIDDMIDEAINRIKETKE